MKVLREKKDTKKTIKQWIKENNPGVQTLEVLDKHRIRDTSGGGRVYLITKKNSNDLSDDLYEFIQNFVHLWKLMIKDIRFPKVGLSETDISINLYPEFDDISSKDFKKESYISYLNVAELEKSKSFLSLKINKNEGWAIRIAIQDLALLCFNNYEKVLKETLRAFSKDMDKKTLERLEAEFRSTLHPNEVIFYETGR